MQATNERVVSIDYRLTDDSGNVLDSSEGRGPLSYLHGAGNIIPGLERALEGKETGDDVDINVPPSEAYGDRDPGLIQAVPRANFPEGVNPAVGQQFQAQTEAGARTVTVVNVADDSVTVDANHPLAGQSLNFSVKVVDVRQATDEELQHGHAHESGEEAE